MSTKIVIKEDVAADTPPSGKIALYAKTDKHLYIKDDTGTETELTVGSGDVAGAPSSTSNAIARFSGTGGKTIKNSSVTISDAGVLDMAGQKIINLATPTNPNDAVNKDYVDLFAQGIVPQETILDPALINDSLSSPPGSPLLDTTYLIGPAPTGDWTAIGAGHIAYWNGSIWKDGLGRAVAGGDRFGINFHQVCSPGGNFLTKQDMIATVISATPGSYSYSYETA